MAGHSWRRRDCAWAMASRGMRRVWWRVKTALLGASNWAAAAMPDASSAGTVLSPGGPRHAVTETMVQPCSARAAEKAAQPWAEAELAPSEKAILSASAPGFPSTPHVENPRGNSRPARKSAAVFKLRGIQATGSSKIYLFIHPEAPEGTQGLPQGRGGHRWRCCMPPHRVG